jgi:hypothetical protein
VPLKPMETYCFCEKKNHVVFPVRANKIRHAQ